MRDLSGQLAQAAQVGVGLARGRVITAQDAAGGCAVAAIHGALDHHGRRARAQDEVRDVRLCCAGQHRGASARLLQAQSFSGGAVAAAGLQGNTGDTLEQRADRYDHICSTCR